MTRAEFIDTLKAIGWSQADLLRALGEAAGRPVRRSTVSDYALGRAKVPPGVALALNLILAAKSAGFEIPRPEHADGRRLRWSKLADATRAE